MSLQLVAILKIVGWILTLAPLVGFLTFAIVMVKEIAKNDDESIKGIVNIGFLVFGIGVVMLLVTYGGEFISGFIGPSF